MLRFLKTLQHLQKIFHRCCVFLRRCNTFRKSVRTVQKFGFCTSHHFIIGTSAAEDFPTFPIWSFTPTRQVKPLTPEEKTPKIVEKREEAEKVDHVEREKQRQFMGKEMAKTGDEMLCFARALVPFPFHLQSWPRTAKGKARTNGQQWPTSVQVSGGRIQS
jgi:hypothetical protein